VSGVVVPFKGEWQGGAQIERAPATQRAEVRALRDARLIRDANREEGNWLNAAFVALLKVLSDDQRRLLEASLAIRAAAAEDRDAEQALAIVRFRTGSPEHCQRVATMLCRMRAEVDQ
jgi:hypothetical protein